MFKNRDSNFGEEVLVLLFALLLALLLSLTSANDEASFRALERPAYPKQNVAPRHLNREAAPHSTPIKYFTY